MKLSRNKESFLSNADLRQSSFQLSVSDLRSITKHYQEKHSIKILINGDTLVGQLMIANNIEIIRRIDKELPRDVEGKCTDKIPYVIYIAYYWQVLSVKKESFFNFIPKIVVDIIYNQDLNKNHDFKLSNRDNESIKKILSELSLLDYEGNVKKSITENEIYQLNTIKQHLFCKFQNSPLPSGFSY